MKTIAIAVLRRVYAAGRAYDGWRRFAREVGGEFVYRGYIRTNPDRPGRWLFGPWVEVHFTLRAYPAILETFLQEVGKQTRRDTRLRLTLPVRAPVHFVVSREGFLSRLGKLVGMHDLQVGHPDFDGAFVVKGNDERTVRSLLDDVGIRQALLEQRGGVFGLRPTDGPEGGGSREELYFEQFGLIKELDRLQALSRLFEETVDRAQRLGLLEGR